MVRPRPDLTSQLFCLRGFTPPIWTNASNSFAMWQMLKTLISSAIGKSRQFVHVEQLQSLCRSRTVTLSSSFAFITNYLFYGTTFATWLRSQDQRAAGRVITEALQTLSLLAFKNKTATDCILWVWITLQNMAFIWTKSDTEAELMMWISWGIHAETWLSGRPAE